MTQPISKSELEDGLREKAKNRWWVMSLFLLTSSAGILNAMHINSYVFLADDPVVWCQVPILAEAGWTAEQIKNISVPNSNERENCLMYQWNYTMLKEMGFERAFEFTNREPKPKLTACTSYAYDETMSTMVSEWDLVCDRTPLKSTIQVAVAVGKFLGSFCFGMLADKFGRRKVYAFCCIIYIISSPAVAICPYYYLLLAFRLLTGVAGGGTYEIGYTILSEMTLSTNRSTLGCLFNMGYAVGIILLPILAYYSTSWRYLQLYMSIPGFLLFIHIWCLPESPRWLISQRRYSEAWKVLKGPNYVPPPPQAQPTIEESHAEKDSVSSKHSWYKKLIGVLVRLLNLFSTCELRKRIIICYVGWFVASLGYFVIALNATNFSSNKYIYVALNGVAEAPGYLLPIWLLVYTGRKASGIILFELGGIALISIIFIPQGSTTMIAMALFGRLCMSAVYAEIILHTSELFPTVIRNTAIGTSLTMAQLGTIIAPFIVDILGNIDWYIPSTVCGVGSIIAGVLIFFLPETNNKPLMETMDDMQKLSPKERTGFANCCTFK